MKKLLLILGTVGVLASAVWWVLGHRSAGVPGSTGRIVSVPEAPGLFSRQSARIETAPADLNQRLVRRKPDSGVTADAQWEKARAERAKDLGVDRPARPETLFTVGKRSYRHLDSIFALSSRETLPSEASVVETRDGLVFFRLEPGAGVPAGAQAVAYEPRSSQLVVITGRLTVQYRASAKPTDVSSDFSLELIHSFDHLNTAVFNGARPSTSKLVQLLTALRNDERVVRADLELIGARRVPQ